MKVEIYWITGAPDAPLGIMPRPRGGDWLEDEIRSLRSQMSELALVNEAAGASHSESSSSHSQ
jgi:hypothetical protein